MDTVKDLPADFDVTLVNYNTNQLRHIGNQLLHLADRFDSGEVEVILGGIMYTDEQTDPDIPHDGLKIIRLDADLRMREVSGVATPGTGEEHF